MGSLHFKDDKSLEAWLAKNPHIKLNVEESQLSPIDQLEQAVTAKVHSSKKPVRSKNPAGLFLYGLGWALVGALSLFIICAMLHGVR